MARSETVSLSNNGYIWFPSSVRRKFPKHSEFKLKCDGKKIVLEFLSAPPPMTKEEAWVRFDAARESIARQYAAKGITVADIRRTIKRLRAEDRDDVIARFDAALEDLKRFATQDGKQIHGLNEAVRAARQRRRRRSKSS